jgi:glutamyl-Q tRNA(Asp) synthetase
VYPGVCRNGLPAGRTPRATRVRTAGAQVSFTDAIQGALTQNVERDVGDFVVRRADGLFAYQLAVVVDDAAQGITDIVRGADLLDSTPRQIHLQNLLGYDSPHYAHLPVAVNRRGEKLSKQTRAKAIDTQQPLHEIVRVLRFLGQPEPEAGLATGAGGEADLQAVWAWAIAHWDRRRIAAQRTITVEEDNE